MRCIYRSTITKSGCSELKRSSPSTPSFATTTGYLPCRLTACRISSTIVGLSSMTSTFFRGGSAPSPPASSPTCSDILHPLQPHAHPLPCDRCFLRRTPCLCPRLCSTCTCVLWLSSILSYGQAAANHPGQAARPREARWGREQSLCDRVDCVGRLGITAYPNVLCWLAL